MRPPAKLSGWLTPVSSSSGTRSDPTSVQRKPPLLHTYTAPSGPIAAPLGPPPRSATIVAMPSGATRVSVPRRISTTSTDPSASATGPSGNWSPSAISRSSPLRPETLVARGAEQRGHDLAVDAGERERPEHDLHGHVGREVGGLAVDHVGDDAHGRILVEAHQAAHERHALAEGGQEGVAHDRPREQPAAAADERPREGGP